MAAMRVSISPSPLQSASIGTHCHTMSHQSHISSNSHIIKRSPRSASSASTSPTSLSSQHQIRFTEFSSSAQSHSSAQLAPHQPIISSSPSQKTILALIDTNLSLGTLSLSTHLAHILHHDIIICHIINGAEEAASMHSVLEASHVRHLLGEGMGDEKGSSVSSSPSDHIEDQEDIGFEASPRAGQSVTVDLSLHDILSIKPLETDTSENTNPLIDQKHKLTSESVAEFVSVEDMPLKMHAMSASSTTQQFRVPTMHGTVHSSTSRIPTLLKVKELVSQFEDRHGIRQKINIRLIERQGNFLSEIEKLSADVSMVVMSGGSSNGDPNKGLLFENQKAMQLVSRMKEMNKLLVVPEREPFSLHALELDLERMVQVSMRDERRLQLPPAAEGIRNVVFAEEFKNGKVQASIIRDFMSNFVEPVNRYRKFFEDQRRERVLIDMLHRGEVDEVISPRRAAHPVHITFLHISCEEESKLHQVRSALESQISRAVGSYKHCSVRVMSLESGLDDSSTGAESSASLTSSLVKMTADMSPDLLVLVRQFRGTTEKYYWELRQSTTESLLSLFGNGEILDEDTSPEIGNRLPPVLVYRKKAR